MTNAIRALPTNRRRSQRGQAMIEFSLCFLLFLGTIVGFGQMAMAVWIKTTLHHAVREGARFAITGQTIGGAGQDSSIQQVISRSTAGVLSTAQAASLVSIEFFDQAGAPTASNAGGNTVVISVRNYPVPMLVPAPVSYVRNALTVSAQAVARLEPYTTAPAR
ncbi:MAG: pilus assembly protein [Acidobacteria bacterium]|nr:pilus assembly protein [Acidobacteriota bacterium]MDA1236094.1 pilus assembly protein [Acidobacteriota bacterium]